MKVRDLFDQCATEYDKDRPKLVPYFNEFYGTAMRMIPFSAIAKSLGIRIGSRGLL